MSKENCIDFITPHATPDDKLYDFNPRSFDDYLGQDSLITKLRVYTQAAHMRHEPLDHLLLFGPPGLGKTTLATIMSHVMGVTLKICSGPMMERTGDLVAILSSLEPRDILFIDEIHRMATSVEEILYSAMEQFRVDVIIGQGVGAKSVSLPLHPFTLIGATTKSGMLSAPLRSRFGISERLDFYDASALAAIVMQNAAFLQLILDYDAAFLIASASRGTPRIAKKILRRVRDFAQVHAIIHITKETTIQALQFLGIDENGLTILDYRILKTIIDLFKGGPVGLETLASLIGEDPETLEEVYEPFLMRKGFLEKTPRGRQIPPIQLPFFMNKFFGQQSL